MLRLSLALFNFLKILFNFFSKKKLLSKSLLSNEKRSMFNSLDNNKSLYIKDSCF
jgi:hypothetical protein